MIEYLVVDAQFIKYFISGPSVFYKYIYFLYIFQMNEN